MSEKEESISKDDQVFQIMGTFGRAQLITSTVVLICGIPMTWILVVGFNYYEVSTKQ